MKIGVLALQGAFVEHFEILQSLEQATCPVRTADELAKVGALIIPGGESTVILKLLNEFNLFTPLQKRIEKGMAVWGTCAGMIVLASQIINEGRQTMVPLKAIDVTVKRNAFGRQNDSFSIDLPFKGLGQPVHAVFIRAPLISACGPQVDVLACLPDGTIVAARQNKVLVTSFHPELTRDNSIHQYFCQMAIE